MRLVDYNFTDMRFTGTLQANNPTDDCQGGQVDNWVNQVTTRCSLEQRSGKSDNLFGKVEYYKTYILRCRFQNPIINGVDMQWIINGEAYMVNDWGRVNMIPFYYEFKLIKNQNIAGGI